jgi:Dullard-like phosphatase family protein
MILGEKLFDIIKYLVNNKKMTNQCYEFLNYFFNSTLSIQINKLFLNSELNNAFHSINYTLMSILVCYDYSFDRALIDKCFSLINETLELINNNYIILGKYIMKKVSKKHKDNKWIYKLNNMLSKNNNYPKINEINNNYILNNVSSTNKIIYNTNIIIKNLKIFLEHYKSNSNESLLILFKKITQKTLDDIKYYYKTFLLREENINGSFLASLYLKDNPNFHSAPKPYIQKINKKNYTLVLDLEETLLNFRLKSENKGEGILKFRPGLFDFLDEVQKFYEIILFTASSQDYAESLIDSIEEKKKYFEYKFFRQHNIILDNDFVKDLSRIGRDLDKIIIVDNMQQNYRLQKKNGIYIKGFWGEDICDKVLFYLKNILIRIANDGGDLRDGLVKYHEEIAEKISSCIYKFNFE